MTYIVTGASSGIGFATAKALALQRIGVIATARSIDQLEALRRHSPEHIQIVPADLSTAAGRKLVVTKAKQIGKVSGIVHAAGSQVLPTSYQNLEAESLNHDFNVHVATPISLNNALRKELRNARIVYIDSYSANTVRVGWSGYSIVKAAAQMAARAAVEEMSESIVIRIFPGAVQTPLVNSILTATQPSPTVDSFKDSVANGEMSQPNVIGEFIANILTKATDDQLAERASWDFSKQADRLD